MNEIIIIEIGKFAWNGPVINAVIPVDSWETAHEYKKKFFNFIKNKSKNYKITESDANTDDAYAASIQYMIGSESADDCYIQIKKYNIYNSNNIEKIFENI